MWAAMLICFGGEGKKRDVSVPQGSPAGNTASSYQEWGFPGGAVVKNLPANAGDGRDIGSIPGLGRSPGGGHGHPLQYSCLKKSHGQRSLVGHSPWGYKESDMTEQLIARVRDNPLACLCLHI